MSNIPSVGRDVHYVSFGSPGGEYPSVCRAAKITEVSTSGVLSLVVFNPEGVHFRASVYESDADNHMGGTWHWPERTPE